MLVAGKPGMVFRVMAEVVDFTYAFDVEDEENWDEFGEYWGPDPTDPANMEEVSTGSYVCVAIGDDRDWYVDEDDMTLYTDDPCSCGSPDCDWS